MSSQYGSSIVRTASQDSGVVLGRPTRITAFTVNAVNADCIVNLRDGGAAGDIRWTLEADNAASSPTVNFPRGLKFLRNLYVEFVVKGTQSSCCIALDENYQ